MAFEYDKAIRYKSRGVARYTQRDACLYALSIGIGRDPLDEKALDYVLETRGPKIVPTMASVIVKSISRELGLHMPKVLHGEQRLRVLRPLPLAAELETESAVTGILDKGPDKGAIVSFDTVARIPGEQEPLFILGHTIFARADGGCGGPSGPSPARHVIPTREADLQRRLATRPDQALLYRLNGDLNPLHAEPEAARRGGFPAPILHGLCTYGIACHAVLAEVCHYDNARMVEFDARFTAPVFPGEEILTEMWVDGDTVSFRSSVLQRNVVTLDGGRCLLRPAA